MDHELMPNTTNSSLPIHRSDISKELEQDLDLGLERMLAQALHHNRDHSDTPTTTSTSTHPNIITTTTDWPSPAKLNLFLYITGQRQAEQDKAGYHDLQTLFQFLDFGDELSITANYSGEISLSPTLAGVDNQDNLIWKAASLLKKYASTLNSSSYIHKKREDNNESLSGSLPLSTDYSQLGAHIELKKVIPMGGGLGGGSSNAATTLIALNHLWRLGLSDEQLATLGLTLGADVPIFVHGFSAFAQGIGEQLTPAEPQEKWYLIIKPNVSIATADIFTHPQLTRNTPARTLATLLQQPYENDCEKIVRILYPEVDQALSWLLQYAPSRLTGTGSCVFAEFNHRQDAIAVLTKLDPGVSAFIAQGRNVSPVKETLIAYQFMDKQLTNTPFI